MRYREGKGPYPLLGGVDQKPSRLHSALFLFAKSLVSSMKPAGFGRRYIALMLDITILEILGILVSWPLVSQTGPDVWQALLKSSLGAPWKWEAVGWMASHLFLQVALISVYFVLFTGITGQTPGKKWVGIRVLKPDGRPLDWTTALTRFFLGYTTSVMTLGLGFLLALIDPNEKALHDKIANTRVVSVT